MALTKRHIVERIQDELDFPMNKSILATESRFEIIKSTLESGEYIRISGFGKFCVKEKSARKGRNWGILRNPPGRFLPNRGKS